MPAERAGAGPDATNAEIYKLICDDLTRAIADLSRVSSTEQGAADRNVALRNALRRMNLVLNNLGRSCHPVKLP